MKYGLGCLSLFVMATIISTILTAIVKKIAVKTNFVAYPQADRFHKSIIPMGGGGAIFATIIIFCITAFVAVKCPFSIFSHCPVMSSDTVAEYIKGFQGRTTEFLIIAISISVLFLLGLWDDLKKLSPFAKLIVQFIVSGSAAYFADVRVEFFIESKVITSASSAFWIVLIMNAFNFLDNMDGASAGIAIIVTLILFVASVMSGQIFVAGFALILAGSMLGFLFFNFFPAGIFMGDAGSLVIGFCVAMLTLKTTYYQQSTGLGRHMVLMPLVIMALPLYDFISVTILRISQGRSLFAGDTQHFSHRLTKRGLSQLQAVLTLYLATLCTGLGAIVLKTANSIFAILIFVQTIMILTIIAILESTGKNDSD